MPTSGDGDLEIEPTPWRRDDIRAGRLISRATVYDEVRAALDERGWVQGRHTHRARLSLTAAIDIVVGSSSDDPGPKGPSLARAARVRSHLCELAGTSNLASWNDDRRRTFDDLILLLAAAAVAYPGD